MKQLKIITTHPRTASSLDEFYKHLGDEKKKYDEANKYHKGVKLSYHKLLEN